jgi:hypothetical protein
LAAQEHDYLAAWLSTRGGDHSLLGERIRARARAQGVNWLLHDLPAPLLFRDRLEATITAAITQVTGTPQNAPVRGNAGRGGAVKGGKARLGTPRRPGGAVQLVLADPA